jgi:hypothetical protein
MTDLRTAAQQALDVLETTISSHGDIARSAITALRAALEQPYAAQARRVEQETQGRMRIDPVTGDVSIGTPAEQPEQEPVAWLWEHQLEDLKHYRYRPDMRAWTTEGRIGSFEGLVPVFNHPPRREWRSLSNEEIERITSNLMTIGDGYLRFSVSLLEFARAIEAKLKELNHE